MKKKKANARKKSTSAIIPILSDSQVSKEGPEDVLLEAASPRQSENLMEDQLELEEGIPMELAPPELDSPLNVVQCRDFLYDSLIRDGNMELLKSHISDVLQFSGWKKTMRDECNKYIKNEGLETLNISHMLCDMIPIGRSEVPTDVRESIKDLLRTIALSRLTIDDSESKPLLAEASDTYLPYVYQPRDVVPDYGDQSIFDEPPDTSYTSAPSPLNSPASAESVPDTTPTSPAANSPGSIVQELGEIALVDREHEDETENEPVLVKTEQLESEPQDTEMELQDDERIRQEQEDLERERLEMERERQEKERQEQRERERQEQKDRERLDKERERQEQKERERSSERRHNTPHQSSSVPSSPSTPRPDKRNTLTESSMMMKLGPVKQPPSLASTLITATAAIAGKKSKHINLNSDNDDDDEDDEELMDI